MKFCLLFASFILQSTNVGISCCMIDWYRLPAKSVQDLVLIIAMSNNPAKISAGRIVNLSLSTFASVIFYKYSNYSKLISAIYLLTIKCNSIFAGSKDVIRLLKFPPNCPCVVI